MCRLSQQSGTTPHRQGVGKPIRLPLTDSSTLRKDSLFWRETRRSGCRVQESLHSAAVERRWGSVRCRRAANRHHSGRSSGTAKQSKDGRPGLTPPPPSYRLGPLGRRIMTLSCRTQCLLWGRTVYTFYTFFCSTFVSIIQCQYSGFLQIVVVVVEVAISGVLGSSVYL